MKTFDFYEFVGILLPGTVAVVGILLLYPGLQEYLPTRELSIGGFGLLVILAYVAGHLFQAAGNLLERVWWRLWGGMPTDWVWRRKRHLLTSAQMKSLEDQLEMKLQLSAHIDLRNTVASDWPALTRQVYAAVSTQGKAGRIDTFNGNYGLNRGLAAVLLPLAVWMLVAKLSSWEVALGLIVASGAAIYRMHQFGRRYAQELFVQFLQLPQPPSAPMEQSHRTPLESKNE